MDRPAPETDLEESLRGTVLGQQLTPPGEVGLGAKETLLSSAPSLYLLPFPLGPSGPPPTSATSHISHSLFSAYVKGPDVDP